MYLFESLNICIIHLKIILFIIGLPDETIEICLFYESLLSIEYQHFIVFCKSVFSRVLSEPRQPSLKFYGKLMNLNQNGSTNEGRLRFIKYRTYLYL